MERERNPDSEGERTMKLGRVFTILTLAGLAMAAGCQDSETDANGEITLSAPPAETEHFDQAQLETAQKLINDGLKYLLRQQRDDGGWSFASGQPSHPALTGLALKALVQHPDFTHESPQIRKGYELMLSYQQDDGGFYDADAPSRQNYTTAVAVMALAAADNPAWQDNLDKGVEYLKSLQIVPGSKTADGDVIQDPNHVFVGGVSYGKHGRPDLSNLGFNLMAMQEAGVPGDSEHVQRALAFVTRTQNLSETNPLGWADTVKDDGGFIYAPAKRDQITPESKVKTGLRSYGSMTYTGFKSMLYAGVDRQDPRVQRAWDWIRGHWTLQKNPAMPGEQAREGLYYYYHMFAKALRAWGEPVIEDTDGEKHNWRHELTDALKERVNENGSWSGHKRWYENIPEMATVYSVLALEEALKK
jgi:squalene-hopene/tetraprenyl-beta-curcumene cyclase